MAKSKSKKPTKTEKQYHKRAIVAVKRLLKRMFFGFTIIELLIVITVIAILVIMSLVAYTAIQKRANITAVQTTLKDVSKQLAVFQAINGNLPSTIDCSQPTSNTNTCIQFNNNEVASYSTNQNNSTDYYVTIDKNGYIYNINEKDVISAGEAPLLDSRAANYVVYNGTGNSWSDINTNSVQNGGYFGFSGLNDYVSSSYLSDTSSENITIAAWVRQGSKNGTYEIMGQGQWGTNYWTNWSFSQIGQTIKFNLTDKNSAEYQCSGGQFGTIEWHYIVGVWDGNYMRTYLDGVEVAACDKASALAAANGTHPVGKYPDGPYYFNGLTGDIKLYDSALSVSDIYENFTISSKFYRP